LFSTKQNMIHRMHE